MLTLILSFRMYQEVTSIFMICSACCYNCKWWLWVIFSNCYCRLEYIWTTHIYRIDSMICCYIFKLLLSIRTHLNDTHLQNRLYGLLLYFQMLVLSYILVVAWILTSAILLIPVAALVLLIYLVNYKGFECINLENYGKLNKWILVFILSNICFFSQKTTRQSIFNWSP